MLQVTPFAVVEGRLFLDLLPWLVALTAIVIVGGVCIYAAKRLLKSDNESVPEGFTLQGLRDLHAAGKLSDDEFAKAKAAMIGQVKKGAERAATSKADYSETTPAADKNGAVGDQS